MKAVRYVLEENLKNLYRIFCIAKYDLLGDMRDSRLGLFWNFAQPAIQMFAYFLFFGVALNRRPVEVNGITVEFLPWLIVGFAAWNFILPSVQNGCSAIHSKKDVISNMQFPTSILPTACICKELFNHLCLCVVAVAVLLLCGYTPDWWWLQVFYYCLAAFCLGLAFSMVLSVLNMIVRDTKKLVVSILRVLFYFTPVVWNCEFTSAGPWNSALNFLLKLNPAYYIVNGYKDSIFYGIGFWQHYKLTAHFWIFTGLLFCTGCIMLFRFRKKFADLI